MAKPALERIIIDPFGTYTTEEACLWLGWSRHTLSKAVHAGRLSVILGGKAWAFVGEDLLNLRETMGQPHARPKLVGGHHAR